ncbi:hypothetical protein CXG81DRAFT_13644 [Caulochytrium protostelioides]|uniref:Acyl-CoA N-acyltransferase n=1 Tax=Caulochytrium protostelioides TaxID=1555241 RepID=A0A4P9X4U8_9FUNG|nr:acyl-CoA N-acyltransferase [Caulochytrium protostelioides]RKP00100.1 hypothetical protein CXG81DRAFT_13644 [Caulochytrium protostelioides]|eukprot:RKP00100.1 hypothetical protein CXG81DRAFT_13644 [Caulochytrium protostelioides]
MITIRQATAHDLVAMQNCNLMNLPENYQMKYYYYHAMTWPQLTYVAVAPSGEVVGYVLGKLDEEAPADDMNGHITSLAVLRTWRRLGIAARLMRQSMLAMAEVFNAKRCSLHVRQSNAAALHLYRDTLQFNVEKIEENYYADGENAYSMRKYFNPEDEAKAKAKAAAEEAAKEGADSQNTPAATANAVVEAKA